jgi:hypothetical protein
VTAIPEEQPPKPAEPSKVIPMESDDYNLSDYGTDFANIPLTYDEE